MEEIRAPISNFQQIDELIKKLEEFQSAHSYAEFQHCLLSIKTKLELMPYNELKYFLKNLVPLLQRVFEYLMNVVENDNVTYMIKILSLEIFSKIIWDIDLIEVYQIVLNFIPKILNNESEDLGIKALKIFLEYYKNMKQPLGFQPIEKFIEFTMMMLKNFEGTVNEVYDKISRENLVVDRPIPLKSSKSFKVMNEIPLILMLAYNLFQEQISNIIQTNVHVFVSVFKVLKPNPFKNCESDPSKKYQISVYEDYLYTLTKMEYLVAFLLKINDSIYENLFKKYADDIVKAVIHILDNIPKDNIHTRKEILSITKNLIKPFSFIFYERNQYFRNEDNLLGRSVISHEYVYYEVNKIIFTLIDAIHSTLNFEEKALLLEELAHKINNYKIGYEFKLFNFYYINLILDSMKAVHEQNSKLRLFFINNLILKELSYFFNNLSKMIGKFENYFVFNANEKVNKNDYLDKNFFEEEDKSAQTDNITANPKTDINAIQASNITRVYELLLNNQYEKYVNQEEAKFIIDLLKHSNALLKLCVTLIHIETGSVIIPTQSVAGFMIQSNFPVNLIKGNPADVNMISQNYNSATSRKLYHLSKLFKAYFNICEKIFKNHTHGTTDDGSGKLYEISLVNIYMTLPSNLCLGVFNKIIPYIFKAIMNNSKVCPNKNCLLSIIIDTIFDHTGGSSQLEPTTRREIFDLFLDYFINKIHFIGNNLKSYDANYQYNTISMSVLINIFKSLFKYLNLVMDEKTKAKITNFLLNCLLLTKNSKFFGNYIYVIRCLFKSLLNISSQSNPQQFEFYKETIHLVYGIMKLMINIKEDFPFLKEMLTEIIMIFPIKFKYMIDYAKIVFPSLIDALNMNQEIIPVGLQYLEQWMNALFHKPENVKPFLQNNINLLTTLLTSHLYKNYAISLNSLKLLSKFGGRSRNYMEDKQINPKTSPTNILVIDLEEISNGKKIEFPIDNIVDLCIKIVTNYKRHSEKNWLNQIKTSFKTLKACFLTFIGEEIDEKFIQDKISDIKQAKHSDEFDKRGYFTKIRLNEEQVKINLIYRKAEHFLVEKLLRGLFLCCTIPEIEEEIKDFVKFICNYFVLIMISKDKFNKNINVFEIDPTIILDIICEFLFSNNPTVFKNNNQTCISIAIKLVNIIIDTIEFTFDKDNEIIKNLEIVDIIFMKFLNSCYNNEWSKKGGGIVTLSILIKRFHKDIVFKYLQHIIRAIFLVTSNYSSTVKIKYEGDCEKILTELIIMYMQDKNDYRVKNTSADDRMIIDDDNATISNDSIAKDFNQFYVSLQFFQEEILNNLHSLSEYSRKMAMKAYELIMKNKILKNNPCLFMLIDTISLEKFKTNYSGDILHLEENFMKTLILYTMPPHDLSKMTDQDNFTKSITSEEFKLHMDLVNDKVPKIYKKFKELLANLSQKLELSSSNFQPLNSSAVALTYLIKHNQDLFVEYILHSKHRFEDFLKLIKNILDILVADMFLYLEITKKILEILYNSKFKYFIIEKFYSTKQLHISLGLNQDKFEIDNDIPDEQMNEVMKYIFQIHHNYIFDQYTRLNDSYSSIEPYICEIFPLLSNKLKMMKNFVKLLKHLFGNKKILVGMKEKYENESLIEKISLDKFFDLKNKCTNLIFRFVIYREEKILLKVSKKYIRKLLKVESSTKSLLPEEELKKCIKPVLEQIAQKSYISFKLVDSLAILIKLLSTNFNDTLGRKLLTSMNDPNINDNQVIHSILSLFAHLKPNQVNDLFPEILEIIFKMEIDALNKNKSYSLFNSRYKHKIIRLLSNFTEILFKQFNRINFNDYNYYNFFKKLIKDESSYAIREAMAKNFQQVLLPNILIADAKDHHIILNQLKIFKVLVKKSPSVMNTNPKMVRSINEYLQVHNKNLYSSQELHEVDRYTDEILNCLSSASLHYFAAFNKNFEILLTLIFFIKKTRINHMKEKIKMFILKDLYKNLTTSKISKILRLFLEKYESMLHLNYLGDVMKYLITPLLIFYIKEKKYDEYLEKYFAKELTRLIFTDEYKRLYDDSIQQEIIKLIIILIIHFMNPTKEISTLNREETSGIMINIANYLTSKYTSSSHSLNLYSSVGLCLVSLLFNRQGDKMLNSLSVSFFRQNQYDHLGIINLCFDIIIPFCMCKPEESLTVLKSLKILLSDRSININQFFHIFSIMLKHSELFAVHKMQSSNTIIQFILKCVSQHMNFTNTQKKMIIQLLGLIIFWYRTEKCEENDEKARQIEKLKDNTLLLLTKYYKMILIHQINDPEYLEIAKKYLLYIKELIKISDFSIKKFFLISENEQTQGMKLFLHAYLYLLKIAILYSKKDSVLQNIDYFFSLLKQLNVDASMNIKATNDATLIVRCITNEKFFNALNEHRDPIDRDTKLKADEQILKYIREFFEHHQNAFNKKKGKLIPEIDFENVNALDVKESDIMKDLFNNIKLKIPMLSHEKLFELFPHFDFRYFTLFYFYIQENILTQETSNTTNNNNTSVNKENIDIVLKLCENLSKLYYENWYIYTLFILQLLKEDEDRIKKTFFENTDCEYFTGSNFFSNLRIIEHLEKLKVDKNPKFFNIDKKTPGFELIMESIFIGFQIAFNNKHIMSTYKNNIMKTLLILIEIMQNTNIIPILEQLIAMNFKCIFYNINDHNIFIVELLKIYDYNNKKVSQNILILILEYMEHYQFENEKNIKEIVKILLVTSRFHEYKLRKRIYKIFEKFNGYELTSKLKVIFQIESKQPEVDNNSWLPYSVDFLLHHFQLKERIARKEYSSKLRKLNYGKNSDAMQLDDEKITENVYNEGNSKFKWINSYNKEINNLKSKNLLIPIRDIVLGDISISQKMWFSIFPQVWKIISKDDQELLAVFINKFLIYLTNITNNQKGPLIVKAMLESLANCFPLVKLNPEVLYILAKNHNSWNSVSFFLEKMLTANVEKERSFNCLNKIYETLKEDDHSVGLKRFVTDNRYTLHGLSYLQCTQFNKAEEIFALAMKNYKDLIDKTDINFRIEDKMLLDYDEDYLKEFPNKIDFSIWEQGLIDSYRNTNKWNNLKTLAEETNNIDIKIESLWHLGKWQEIESMNLVRHHYLAKINQIYMMMKDTRADTSYQQKCMDCIRIIFQDFSSYPPNFEKLNYHYYLVFQLIVEAWESTNTLKEIERNNQEKKPSDFRENLIMWRDRIPHVCEGFYSLKSILDPRNYLFEILRDSIKNIPNATGNALNITQYFPNISDHLWNNMIFLKYSRKMNLLDVYIEYNDKFNKEIQNLESVYPIEYFLKNMENFKIYRKVNKNFTKGLELVDEILGKLSLSQPNINNLNTGVETDFKASYLCTKGYFSYKLGKVAEASESFKEAIKLNQTDYHIWQDWAEMSDSILNTIKDEPLENIWFENTFVNYLMVIVFKLDKAKYVVPRLFTLLKKFPHIKIENKFEKQLENIPTWIWIFWIPQLLELLKSLNHRNFGFTLLKKISHSYPQYMYYPLTILIEDTKGGEITRKYEELKSIITSQEKYTSVINKIDLIKRELAEKLDHAMEEIILNHLMNYLDINSCRNVNEGVEKINYYIKKLKSTNHKLEYIDIISAELSSFLTRKDVTIFDLYEKIKAWRYFIQSKIATESNFKDLSGILTKRLYNTNFDDVEIPGYFMNKIVEPTNENRVFITRFESEFSFKFINFSQKKLLIRGSNEKVFYFSITLEKQKENTDYKILQLQTLLNFIFASNKDTYKSNVKFIVPIKYTINPLLKIVQEETNQYYMNEVYDFCMQKLGFDPEVSFKLYEEEYKKTHSSLYSANHFKVDILAKVYSKMCELLPLYSLKSFIHKFIINCDEIFIFRKQFATSYALNNVLAYILKIQDRILLNKISFNKESGSVTFHDVKYHQFEDYNKITNYKRELVPFRISKNINYFLSPSCLYGIFPGITYYAVNALTEKSVYLSNILFTTMYSSDLKNDENEENRLTMNHLEYTERIKKDIVLLNNRSEDKQEEHPMRVILELINQSTNDELLAKMSLSWNPWF